MKSVTLVRRMNASLETVFDALVTPEGIAVWWNPARGPVLKAESDPRVGGRYRVRYAIDDGSEHEANGEFLEYDPPNRVVMSFRWATVSDDSGPSRLEMSLRRIGGETELTLVHSDLRDDEVQRSHEEGWNAALDNLKSWFARASS